MAYGYRTSYRHATICVICCTVVIVSAEDVRATALVKGTKFLRCVESAVGHRQSQLCLRLVGTMQSLLTRKTSLTPGSIVKRGETLQIKQETEVFGQVFQELGEHACVKLSTDMKGEEKKLENGNPYKYWVYTRYI